MILSDIISALTKELKYFFLDKQGTVLLDTELQGDITASFPLCILEISEAPESARLPGNGFTRMDWSFGIRIYAFEPNAYNSDDGGYSASLMQIVDDVRVHFSNEVWLVQEMKDLTTNYAFRLTYGGTVKAESLEIAEKVALGYKHTFESIAIDSNTRNDTDNENTTNVNSGTVVFEGET